MGDTPSTVSASIIQLFAEHAPALLVIHFHTVPHRFKTSPRTPSLLAIRRLRRSVIPSLSCHPMDSHLQPFPPFQHHPVGLRSFIVPSTFRTDEAVKHQVGAAAYWAGCALRLYRVTAHHRSSSINWKSVFHSGAWLKSGVLCFCDKDSERWRDTSRARPEEGDERRGPEAPCSLGHNPVQPVGVTDRRRSISWLCERSLEAWPVRNRQQKGASPSQRVLC